MHLITSLINFILHIDTYIIGMVNYFGIFSYIILFLIIFIETGLVVVPFVPGDSILFVVGLLASQKALNLFIIMAILMIAAILGDACNYFIGHYFGNKILKKEKVQKLIGKQVETTKEFFDKHGSAAIVYARFVPIVRTIAPFLAGVSNMTYRKFAVFNIVGGISWILSITLAGYFLGNIPFVRGNLTLIIFLIVFLSLLPPIIAYIKSKKRGR